MNYEAALGLSAGLNVSLFGLLVVCFISRECLRSDLEFSRRRLEDVKKAYDLGVETHTTVSETLDIIATKIKELRKTLR